MRSFNFVVNEEGKRLRGVYAAIQTLNDMVDNHIYNERKENALMDLIEDSLDKTACCHTSKRYDIVCRAYDKVCERICSR